MQWGLFYVKCFTDITSNVERYAKPGMDHAWPRLTFGLDIVSQLGRARVVTLRDGASN